MNVEEKFNLLCTHLWSFEDIKTKYGIDLDKNMHLLAQYRIWVEGYRKDFEKVLSFEAQKLIHRNLLELFFQYRELVPIKYAAISLAMNPEDLERVLNKACEKEYITESERNGDFNGVFRLSTLKFWKRFKSLQHRIFLDHDNFIDHFYSAIKTELGINDMTPPIKCFAASSISQNDCAITFDSITGQPLGLRFQEFLNIPKPIQLAPDVCSIKTYKDNESFLSGKMLGRISQEYITLF